MLDPKVVLVCVFLVAASVDASVKVLDGGKGIHIEWENLNTELHAEWLRERCQSEGVVDLVTLQPKISPHDYTTPRIERAQIVKTDASWNHTSWLRVAFADGHMSSYEMSTLSRKVNAEKAGQHSDALMQVNNVERPERVPWHTDMPSPNWTLPTVEYRKLMSDSNEGDWTKLSVLSHLISAGIVLVRGVPQQMGQCVDVARKLSTLRVTEWGEAFDVKYTATGTTSEVKTGGITEDEGHKDLAYTGEKIDMHTDNPYRYPTPDFQLLHAIRQCSCADVNETAPCESCSVTNGLVDGLSVAEIMARESPELFDALVSTPVRFENDGGGNRSALWHISPHFKLKAEHAAAPRGSCRGSHCIESIRYSAKSGGYAPIGTDLDKLDLFYKAKRRFSQLVHDTSRGIKLQLSSGDMIIFDNNRVLHSRSSIAATDGSRHLQGCYLDRDGVEFHQEKLRRAVINHADEPPKKQAMVSFRSLGEGTKEDIDLMTAQYVKACSASKLAHRSLSLLRALDSPDTMLGARVSLYEHSLQTASRAHKDGADEETVVVALLHDIGELISPSAHGDVAAGILVPFISPKNHWVLSMHEIFQGFHYFHHIGGNRHQRDDYKNHTYYQACVDFCDKWDQTSFDETYKSLPLSFFEPMVERIFSRKPYWWNPSHPKALAVTGGD